MKVFRFNPLLQLIFILLVLMHPGFNKVSAQPGLPPRVMTVKSTQTLYFGTLSVREGAGKSVSVSPEGFRTATGNVQLLSRLPEVQPAIFEIRFASGRNIAVSYTHSITLTGNHGGTIELILGPSNKGENGASFLTEDHPDFITRFCLGGTLLFNDQIPIPGSYSGYYAITFHQQ